MEEGKVRQVQDGDFGALHVPIKTDQFGVGNSKLRAKLMELKARLEAPEPDSDDEGDIPPYSEESEDESE